MAEAIDGGDIAIEMHNAIAGGLKNQKEDSNKKKTVIQVTNTIVEGEVNVLDRVPADISLAEKHAKAKRVAKPIEDCKDICECCGNQVENLDISMFCHPVDLSFLGPGVPLYFGFVKACSILLIVAAIIYSTYGMILNKAGEFCITPPNGVSLPNGYCYKNIFNEYSLINRVDEYDSLKHQNWVNLGVVLALVITLHLYRRHMRQQEELLDYYLTSPSDFTVQLSGLPPKYKEADIRRLLEDWWNMQSEQTKTQVGQFSIEKVSIAYDVQDYITKINQRSSISLQMRKNDYFEKIHKSYPPKQPSREELKAQRIKIQQEIDALEKEVFDGHYDKTTPHSFVTLNTRKSLECLIDSQSISTLQRIWIKIKLFFGSELYEILNMKYGSDTYIISVCRAPEPSDIKWENCSATNFQKASKRLITWICTLIILGICFILIYLINKWQYDVNKENKNNANDTVVKAKLTLLSLFSSFSIVFINNSLTIILRILSNIELQSTATQLNTSVAEKLTIAQFCNSALITLAVNFTIDSDSFWGNGGITNDFTLIALSNCIIPPVMNFLNPWHLIRICKRRSIRNDKNGLFSQGEANNWFEGGPLDIAIKYAAAIKTLWMIGFYTPLSPYLPCFGIVTLFFSYWMDKYILVNRQARPNLLGSDLNKEMIEMAEYFPFSIAIGNLVWMRKLEVKDKDSLILQLVAIGISALNFIIPSGKINKMLFKIEEMDDSARTGTYQKNKYNFNVDYDRCNPITKEEAIKSFFNELKQKDSKKAEEFKQKLIINNPSANNILVSNIQQPHMQYNNYGYNQQISHVQPQYPMQSHYEGMPPVQYAPQVQYPQQQPLVESAYVVNPLLGNAGGVAPVNQQPFGAQPPQPPDYQYPPPNQGYSPYQQQQQQPIYNPGISQYKYPNQLPYSNNMFDPAQQNSQQVGYGYYDYSNRPPHQNQFA